MADMNAGADCTAGGVRGVVPVAVPVVVTAPVPVVVRTVAVVAVVRMSAVVPGAVPVEMSAPGIVGMTPVVPVMPSVTPRVKNATGQDQPEADQKNPSFHWFPPCSVLKAIETDLDP
jgi:hypothetical protein